MRDLGYKIVDRDPATLAPILEDAVAGGRPVEVGLFFGEPGAAALIASALAPGACPVNTHLDHERLNVLALAAGLDPLRAAIDRSLGLGADYAVIHPGAYPMTRRRSLRGAMLERLLAGLESAEALLEERGFRLHVENTFHELDLYRDLLESVVRAGLRRAHFCFDLGHAKVWSDQTLGEWTEFLERLDARGIALHFHLHANHGLVDEHYAFCDPAAPDMDAADHFAGQGGYRAGLARLRARFPASRKVFEVPPEGALENLRYVERRLA